MTITDALKQSSSYQNAYRIASKEGPNRIPRELSEWLGRANSEIKRMERDLAISLHPEEPGQYLLEAYGERDAVRTRLEVAISPTIGRAFDLAWQDSKKLNASQILAQLHNNRFDHVRGGVSGSSGKSLESLAQLYLTDSNNIMTNPSEIGKWRALARALEKSYPAEVENMTVPGILKKIMQLKKEGTPSEGGDLAFKFHTDAYEYRTLVSEMQKRQLDPTALTHDTSSPDSVSGPAAVAAKPADAPQIKDIADLKERKRRSGWSRRNRPSTAHDSDDAPSMDDMPLRLPEQTWREALARNKPRPEGPDERGTGWNRFG